MRLKDLPLGYLQEVELFKLLRKAKNTRFGNQHNFNYIHSIEEYQKAVPLRTYEHHWNDFWKESFPILHNCTWPGAIKNFAVSSGTSLGSKKYIPCSSEMIRSNVRAGIDILSFHIHNFPSSKLSGGKSFMLGGSTDLKEECSGVYSGDLSGISVKEMPWWARMRYFPPLDLALMKDWEKKIEVLALRSVKEDIRMISGVPSWLIIFFDTLTKLTGKEVHEAYPNLEMVVHGGVSFEPYRERFQYYLEKSSSARAKTVDLREVYPASEGFIAVADKAYGEGLRLICDNGIFFEFVPVEELNSENPRRFWIETIELNVNYAVIVTTNAGLWSYILGDTVRFIEKDPPRLLVTGRTSYSLSAFGEHLIAEEIEDAVMSAARGINIEINEYTVGALYPDEKRNLGGHLYVVELKKKTLDYDDRERFKERIDEVLCRRNEDYEAHRANGFGLEKPKVLFVKHGTFQEWMKSKGKLGGQHKVPRIMSKREVFEGFVESIQEKVI
jgi:hypothetical protein